jgi:hypothetical protein
MMAAMRFTIRDLFWCLLVVGLFLTWWREGINLDSEKRVLLDQVRLAESAQQIAEAELLNGDRYYIAEGWHTYCDPNYFEIGLDGNIRHGGDCSAFVKALSPSPNPYFGSLIQSFSADEYRGKRVRLSAFLRLDSAQATLVLRFFDGNRATAGNTRTRFRPGTIDWQKFDLVLDIPSDAERIGLGIVVKSGSVWLDDVTIAVVGSDVPVTAAPIGPQAWAEPQYPRYPQPQTKPVSLGFELPKALNEN